MSKYFILLLLSMNIGSFVSAAHRGSPTNPLQGGTNLFGDSASSRLPEDHGFSRPNEMQQMRLFMQVRRLGIDSLTQDQRPLFYRYISPENESIRPPIVPNGSNVLVVAEPLPENSMAAIRLVAGLAEARQGRVDGQGCPILLINSFSMPE